jgi:hypothetical protein
MKNNLIYAEMVKVLWYFATNLHHRGFSQGFFLGESLSLQGYSF